MNTLFNDQSVMPVFKIKPKRLRKDLNRQLRQSYETVDVPPLPNSSSASTNILANNRDF